MGCTGLALALLLALAVPASIARASLFGALLVIVLLAAAAVAVIVLRARRRALPEPDAPIRSVRSSITAVVIVAVLYAGVVTLIHGV